MIYRFDDFELDTTRRTLLCGGAVVALNSKTLDLLIALVENQGAIVSKDDLLEKVWANQFVEENNLTVHISALRKALGERKGENRFLITVPGKGYKFVAGLNDETNGEIIIENHKIERITIDEETETPNANQDQLLAEKPSERRMIFVPVVLILLIAGAFFAFRYFKTDSAARINSLAVLPFVNQTNDENNEYLSDGLAESVTYRLSQSPELKVLSRNSVFRYKGKDTDAKTVGAELNVQAILTGRVFQHGDTLNVSAELISTADNSVIWGEQFTRKISDVEKLQNDIAASISSKLRFKISGVKTYGTESAEAYKLYLKGQLQWNKRTEESLKLAADLYRQAIEHDPNYALAYAGLAETYVLFSGYDVASAKDSMPQAKAAALKALELDESLAEAHTALGFYLNYYEWDRAGAEREFRRAIELNPNYATAHHWLGADCLVLVKRYDDALESLKHAEELDPLSSAIGKDIGITLTFARRYDEAVAQLQRVVALDPGFAVGHGNLAIALQAKGLYSESIAEYRKALNLSYSPIGKAYLALALSKNGERDEAHKLLEQLKSESAKRFVPNYALALAHLGFGEKDQAYEKLEKEMDDRGYWAGLYAVAPELDGIRGEPRFKAMLKKMNLPE